MARPLLPIMVQDADKQRFESLRKHNGWTQWWLFQRMLEAYEARQSEQPGNYAASVPQEIGAPTDGHS